MASQPQKIVIGLAGNPNVGKSTVFNRLTGLHQHTGNWTGKTVANAVGTYVFHGEQYELIDTPGTYSLWAKSPEEQVTSEFVRSGNAQALVVVCDATCLERNLILLLQILEVTPCVLLCLNLMDEAAKRRMSIDTEKLERLLGIPVAPVSARGGSGMEGMKEKLSELVRQPPKSALTVQYPPEVETALQKEKLPRVQAICALRSREQAEEMTACLAAQAEELAGQTVTCGEPKKWDERWDALLLGRFTAVPIMLLLLAGIFWLTAKGANVPSAVLSRLFAAAETPLAGLLAQIGLPAWVGELLVQGAFRTTGWVVAVMLPPMAIFFPLFTLLEDAGCLPRIAFNLDHAFARCHACGKQALTVCMSLGCNAVGVEGCRIIGSPRERLIAILTASLTPCNGRLPLLAALCAIYFGSAAGLMMPLLLLCSLGMTLGLSWLLSFTLLRGEPSAFTLELPPYRMPRIGTVLVRSVLDRTLFVLGRAVCVAAPCGLLLWVLANGQVLGQTPLAWLCGALQPIGWLMGMDGVMVAAFLLALPANEIVLPIAVMAYCAVGTLAEPGGAALQTVLSQNGWTTLTAFCVMLFSMFHWPCSTTLLTIYKETKSRRWTMLAAVLPTVAGVLCCILTAAVVRCIC